MIANETTFNQKSNEVDVSNPHVLHIVGLKGFIKTLILSLSLTILWIYTYSKNHL